MSGMSECMHLSTVEITCNPLVGSTSVRGSATGDSLILPRMVFLTDVMFKDCCQHYYRLAQRAPLGRYPAEALYKCSIALHCIVEEGRRRISAGGVHFRWYISMTMRRLPT